MTESDRLRDDLHTAISAAASAIAAAQAAFDRLRAPTEAPLNDRPDHGLTDLISSAAAARLARRAKSTMNSWCREHAINGDAGFAIKIGTRWFVSKSRLLRHLASGSRDLET